MTRYVSKGETVSGGVLNGGRSVTDADARNPVIILMGNNRDFLPRILLRASVEGDAEIYVFRDNDTWVRYRNELPVTENGTWYFLAVDEAGQVGRAEMTFNNIRP